MLRMSSTVFDTFILSSTVCYCVNLGCANRIIYYRLYGRLSSHKTVSTVSIPVKPLAVSGKQTDSQFFRGYLYYSYSYSSIYMYYYVYVLANKRYKVVLYWFNAVQLPCYCSLQAPEYIGLRGKNRNKGTNGTLLSEWVNEWLVCFAVTLTACPTWYPCAFYGV